VTFSPVNSPHPILLFLHIQKTAGTTLEKYFYAAYDPGMPTVPGEDGYLNYGVYHYPGGFDKEDTAGLPDLARILRRSDVQVAMGHFSFGVHAFQSRPASYVTMLRDPLERVISLGSHYLMWSDEDQKRSVSAEELEQYLLHTMRTEFDNDQTRRVSGLEPEFGCCTASMLDQAKRNLREHFSVVGLTERFDESLILFKRVLAWSWDDVYYLPRLVNPRRPPLAALQPLVLDLIRGRNELDLELYRYAAALFERLVERQGPDFEGEVRQLESLREAHIREYGFY